MAATVNNKSDLGTTGMHPDKLKGKRYAALASGHTSLSLSSLCGAILALLSSTAAYGLDWKVTPTLNAQETYSDNVNLSPSGQEKSGFITQINPGASIRGTGGGRVKLNVDYTLQNLITLGETQRNRAYHQLNGNANAELVDQTLFLDARANVSQQNISLFGPIGLDNTTGDPSNITTVSIYSVSPYLRHKFGNFATGEARVTHDGTFYTTGGAANSSSNALGLKLNSGTAFNEMYWGADYSTRKINYDDGQPDREYRSASGTLGYRLTRKLRVFGTAGNETNTFPAAPGASTGGSFWSAGFGWTPSIRTSIEASYGHRFFGKTYSLDLSQRTRHTFWQAQYVQDVTDTRTLQQQGVGIRSDYTCPGGNTFFIIQSAGPVLDLSSFNCQLTSSRRLFQPFLTNDTFINKRFTGSVGITTGKSTITLGAFNSIREFQLSGTSDQQYGGTASWGFRVAPRLTSTLSTGWTRFLVPANALEDDLWNVRLGLTREFQPKVHGTLELRHQARNSNQISGDYKENAVTAWVNMTF